MVAGAWREINTERYRRIMCWENLREMVTGVAELALRLMGATILT